MLAPSVCIMLYRPIIFVCCRPCEGFDIVRELCIGGRDHQREPRGQHGGQESLKGTQLAQGPVRFRLQGARAPRYSGMPRRLALTVAGVLGVLLLFAGARVSAVSINMETTAP